MSDGLQILYEDNHLLAVVKPPGMLSQADSTGDRSLVESAKTYLKEKYDKPGAVYLGLVHRLDRPTGGAMLTCRTSKAAGRMSEQFRTRQINKIYLCLCHGELPPGKQSLVHHLQFDSAKRRQKILSSKSQNSQQARLSYERLSYSSSKNLSLAKVRLETGRKHQIRAQFSAQGFPLLADRKYGKGGRGDSVVRAIGLWSYQLEFVHPVQKTSLTIRSLPQAEWLSQWSEFESILSSLECRES